MAPGEIVFAPAGRPVASSVGAGPGVVAAGTCALHQPGCCRVVEVVADEAAELRAQIIAIRHGAADVLAGHATYDLAAPSLEGLAAESDRVCPCSGCAICRAVYRDVCVPLRSPADQRREIERARS